MKGLVHNGKRHKGERENKVEGNGEVSHGYSGVCYVSLRRRGQTG